MSVLSDHRTAALGAELICHDWFVNLSVFKLYGDPLVDGVNWKGLCTLLAVGLAGSLLFLGFLSRR